MLKKFVFLLFVFCSLIVYGQDVEIRGKVVDDTNEPLPGVSVVVKGTSSGTATGLDGDFAIAVALNQTLVFSFTGMAPQEIIYTGQPFLNVSLKDDNKLLEEVVVIGYQTIKKADLTGAVSVFNVDQMKNKSVTGTVGDALGTLPGVNVRTAGNPGSEGKVEIRGTGTFGSSAPLYVVDGVVSGANRDFNFNDIESIQVLKDASAAAIYGSRAGNGVIIITTKQGKEGKMKIDVSSRLTLQWLPKYDLADRDQWIYLNDMAFTNAGKATANHFDGNTDWQKEVFKTGVVQDHNVSFSGGAKDNRYFISGNFQNNTGTTIGTSSERFTLRANTSGTRDFGNNILFRIGENMALSHYSVDELTINPMYDVFEMLPTISIYNPDHEAMGGYGYGDINRDITFGVNPFARADFEKKTNTNLRIRGNIFTELEALKVLKYKFNLGFDFSNDKYQYLRKEGSWRYNQPPDPSSLNKNQAQSSNLVFDNTLEFNKQAGKHSINAVAGISYQSVNYEQVWGTKNNVLTNGPIYFEELDAALLSPKTGSFKNIEKLFSVFGRVNYNYDEKYLFSATMRRDESSKFSKNERVGYFPSVSVGWRISNESFFHVPVIDDLKIRANYGVLGTSNNNYYDYITLIRSFPQAVFRQDKLVNGMTQIELTNDKLKWEEMAQFNAGIDLSMLNNRLQLSADYFIKESRDVLTRVPLILSLGHSGEDPWINSATLRNKGVELSFTWKDRIGKDMDYSINVNGSYLKNEITKLGYEGQVIDKNETISKKGGSIGQWYLIKTDGIFKSEEEILAHVNSEGKVIQPNARPGDIRYVDYNGDGEIHDNDRQYCGESIPKYELGLNLGFRYKSFDLQAQWAGAFGHKIYNGPRSVYDKFQDNSSYRANYDAWTPDNPNAKDPRPIYDDSRNSIAIQDRWLENGNYFRLKQLSLGYNVPRSCLGNVFQNIRVYVNAQNLVTFTSYTGLDPEFLNSDLYKRSFDGGPFPNPRAVTFGAQISF